MKIIKKINTSAALAIDSSGHEVMVLGKGVGFPKVPYELKDLSIIERTFYDIDPKYIGMIAELPKNVLLVSGEIAEQAEINLNCELNPNLPVTLADHISFALERIKAGIDVTAPIAYDICHLYPKEYELGKKALRIVEEKIGTTLPEHEAISIALHLINSEIENGDLHDFITAMNVVEEINHIVEDRFEIAIDKQGYNYSRFVTHIRYLIQRLKSDVQEKNQVNSMRQTMMREYPEIYYCALKVTEYLDLKWGWKCNDDEVVYLMLHIHRLINRNTKE